MTIDELIRRLKRYQSNGRGEETVYVSTDHGFLPAEAQYIQSGDSEGDVFTHRESEELRAICINGSN